VFIVGIGIIWRVGMVDSCDLCGILGPCTQLYSIEVLDTEERVQSLGVCEICYDEIKEGVWEETYTYINPDSLEDYEDDPENL
jgi:hypothetical protein